MDTAAVYVKRMLAYHLAQHRGLRLVEVISPGDQIQCVRQGHQSIGIWLLYPAVSGLARADPEVAYGFRKLA
jgi:hypothetical protein